MRLMNGDRDPPDPLKCEQRVGDTLGEPFDQVDMLPFDDPNDRLRRPAIIHRVIERVRPAGSVEIKLDCRIDDERLRPHMLMLQHAMRTLRTDSCERDGVHVRSSFPNNECRIQPKFSTQSARITRWRRSATWCPP